MRRRTIGGYLLALAGGVILLAACSGGPSRESVSLDEYFDRVQAPAVLAEWRRVLKPSATLRLAVPDFGALVEVYQKYGELQRVLGPLYGRWGIDVDGSRSTLYHRTVYDFDSLKVLLMECGFTNVRRYVVEDTIHKDYDDYSQAYVPHMDSTGILISLNVEADKEP